MSRRRTKRTTYQRRGVTQKKNSPQLRWLLGGILIGLVIPGILYLKFSGSESVDTSGAYIEEDSNEAQPAKRPHAAIKSKSTTKESPKHAHYDFYNLLSKPSADLATLDSDTPSNEKKFSLETHSLANYEEADQLKAELALNGIDEVIISKLTRGKETGYKIVIGPYQTKEAARKAQAFLKESSVKSTIIIID
jgi:cell division protein FtsN